MAFRLPVFNMPVNIWRATTPVTDPPDVTAVGNFNIGRRISGGDYWTTNTPRQWYCTVWLLLPKGTDIRGDGTTGDQGDTVAVAGSYYHVFFAERSALGFANEHVAAILAQLGGPPPPPPPPPPVGDMLMEDGTDMLMEDGSGMSVE